MAYSWEFRVAATRMRAAAEDATGASTATWTIADDHGIVGGRLQQIVDAAFAANALNASTLAANCDAIATECEARAIACDEFRDLHDAWERSHARWAERNRTYRRALRIPDLDAVHPGPEPAEPKPPHSWIDIY